MNTIARRFTKERLSGRYDDHNRTEKMINRFRGEIVKVEEENKKTVIYFKDGSKAEIINIGPRYITERGKFNLELQGIKS